MIATMNASNPDILPERDAPFRLRGVYETKTDGCRDELVLDLDGASLTFKADPDTDAIDAFCTDGDFHPSGGQKPLADSPFDPFAGAELGWTWLATNQQGYCDSALLSFNGIVPNLMVHVIGSAIRVFAIAPGGI